MPESPNREQILAQLAEIQKRKSTMSDRMAALEARLSPAVAPASTEGPQPRPAAVEPTLPPFEPFIPPAAPAPSVEPTAAAGYVAAASGEPTIVRVPDAPVAPAASGAPASPGSGDPTSAQTRVVEDAAEKVRADVLRHEVTTIGGRIDTISDETDELIEYFDVALGKHWDTKDEFHELMVALNSIRNTQYGWNNDYEPELTDKNSTQLAGIRDAVSALEQEANGAILILRAKKAELRRGASPADDAEGETDEATKDKKKKAPKEKKAAIPLTEQQRAAKELEKLRSEYMQAKKHYEKFQGILGMLDRFIADRRKIKKEDGTKITRLKDAEEKLLEAKEKYDAAFTEYKDAHMNQYVNTEILKVDDIVNSERTGREKNKFLNIQDHWKKLGLVRGATSLALLGAGAYLGMPEASVVRRGLGGGAAGFGAYDLWNMGVQFLREHVGKLRELKPETITKIKSLEEVGKYLAAFEIDAATKRPTAGKKDSEELAVARKGIDLKDDIRYIKLLERWDELKQEQSEHRADAFEDALDEWGEDTDEKIREKARKSEKTKRKVLAGAGILASAVVGYALGSGMIQAALGLGGEVYAKAKEGVEGYDWGTKEGRKTAGLIKHLQGISRKTLEAISGPRGLVAQAAAETQTELTAAGASPDAITEAVGKASDQAREAAKEAWKKSMEAARKAAIQHAEQGGGSPEDIADAAYDASLENIEKAKSAAQTAVDSKVGDIIAEGQKAAEEARRAAQEAAAAQAAKAAGESGAAAAAAAPEAGGAPKDPITKLAEQAAHTKGMSKKKAVVAIAKKAAELSQEYKGIATKWGDVLTQLSERAGKGGKISLKDWEHIRNLASWKGTELGNNAAELMEKIQKADLLSKNGIYSVTIDGDHDTIYKAIAETQKTHPELFAGGKTPDSVFEAVLDKYGIEHDADQLDKLKEALAHESKAPFPKETVWVSSDGALVSQYHELLENVDAGDAIEDYETQGAADAAEKAPAGDAVASDAQKQYGPPVPIDLFSSKEAAKIAAQGATTSSETGGSSLAESPGGTNVPSTTDAANTTTDMRGLVGDIKGLPKGWEWIASAESIKNLPVEQIQSSPEIFYKHIIKPLIGSYPRLGTELFNQESIAKLIRDPQHGKENISQLYDAFIAEKKSPITLHLTEHEEPIVIDPRK